MIAGNLGTSLPEVIARHHRTAVLMEVCIAGCTIRVIRTTGQRQTYNLPSVLVEQDEHRLNFRLYELEGSIVHRDGLENVLFIQELLTCGMCLTTTAIVVVYPRL